MPELPEVETVAAGLRSELLRAVFVDVRVLWERTVDRPDVPAFCAGLVGASIVDVSRRGKFIAAELNTGMTLFTHLRMTGRLLLLPAQAADQPTLKDDGHVRIQFDLDDGRLLVFSDTRKFGRMYLVDSPVEIVGGLGPEPLSSGFTSERLVEMLAKRRGRVKPLLLNQEFVAGLGNIYSDEALWRAQVHPMRTADTLTSDEVARLHVGIVSVLNEAIAGGGSSLRDLQYRQPDGGTGEYQDLLAVYGRAGQSCPRCGALIERIVLGQRGTHLCPVCQELPK